MNKKSALLLILGASAKALNYDPTVISYAYAGDCLDYTTFNTYFGGVVYDCGD